MTRDREVAVAVVGLGFGAVHARVLSEMDGVDLVAVCDVDERRLATATRGRTLKAYRDYEALFRDERLDAVVVAVPTRLHEKVALAGIEAGVPALVEKPVAPDLAAARRLYEAAEKASVRVMPGHIERFNPAVVELRRRVHDGQIGHVLQLTARRLGPFAARVRDVSVVHDLALHDIDVMRHVLGLEVESVFAETQSEVRTPLDDSLLGLLRFAARPVAPAPVALLEVNWLTPRKVRELWVLGQAGLFILDYLAQTLELHENLPGESEAAGAWSTLATLRGAEPGAVTRIPVATREPLERELSAFVAAVRSGSPMPLGREDALAAVAIADALTESARTGMPVKPAQDW